MNKARLRSLLKDITADLSKLNREELLAEIKACPDFHSINDKEPNYTCEECIANDKVDRVNWTPIKEQAPTETEPAIIGRACNCKDFYEPKIANLELQLKHEQRQVKAKTELMNKAWSKVEQLQAENRELKEQRYEFEKDNAGLTAKLALANMDTAQKRIRILREEKELLQQQLKEAREIIEHWKQLYDASPSIGEIDSRAEKWLADMEKTKEG